LQTGKLRFIGSTHAFNTSRKSEKPDHVCYW